MPDFCCVAQGQLLPCKQPLILVSGIHKFSPIPKRSCSATSERGTYMSTSASVGLLPSSTLFGLLMASIDRLLTASSRIAIRNRDLPYFVFDAKLRGFWRRKRAAARASPISIQINGPRFPGPFSFALAGCRVRHRDKLAASATAEKTVACWHIIYKNNSTLISTKERTRGWARAVRKDSERDVGRKDGQRMHASRSSLRFSIDNWPKGADAAPAGPSYNSSLQRSAMRQPLRRDDQGCKKTRNV